MKFTLARFLNDESGATAVEYSLMAALIDVIAISALTKLGSNLSNKFNNIAGNVT